MLVRAWGSAVYGVEAIAIAVEVNVMKGKFYFIVGLPDNAVRESLQRVESALKTNGFAMPRTKVLVNLAPAHIRKSGSFFDLPIAIGILAASGQIGEGPKLADYVMMGELNLDGSICPIRGALPIALQAARDGFRGLILPAANAAEAAVARDLAIYPVSRLREVADFFRGGPLDRLRAPPAPESPPPAAGLPDFSEVTGQETVKRALEIAAAGGHNAILIGPPGAGKTMLARRLPGILPPMTGGEALETTKIHSVAGLLPLHATLMTERPFRDPHHTISEMAMVGGGSVPQPGEISLAHHGVLFLDELPEFRRSVLEVLRQPMEERRVTISRARISTEFPASFMLIASMNPCPCGYFTHPTRSCTCPPGAVRKYLQRISGPLLDRIDLHVEVTPVSAALLGGAIPGEPTAAIRDRVMAARERQSGRFADRQGLPDNAHMGARELRTHCRLETAAATLLRAAMEKLQLSARAYDRILRVARTIADLAGSENIRTDHLAEAIQYRSLDRGNRAESD